MPLRIGDDVPGFSADTTEGRINFHDWIGDGWAVLFSHPKDFTPVCTTELGYMAGLKAEFEKRNCKIIGLSIDSVEDHKAWSKDIEESQGHAINYPLIGDTDLEVAKAFDMIHPNASGSAKERTAADNQTVRSVFLVGPDKKVKAMVSYPMSTGRNFDEILRVLDSCQLTAKHKVATPVNWKQGEDVIIVPAVSDDEARVKFPDGWHSPKPYIRIVPQPRD
jgi:thioredoxin-dependent peroxiredoxin